MPRLEPDWVLWGVEIRWVGDIGVLVAAGIILSTLVLCIVQDWIWWKRRRSR